VVDLEGTVVAERASSLRVDESGWRVGSEMGRAENRFGNLMSGAIGASLGLVSSGTDPSQAQGKPFVGSGQARVSVLLVLLGGGFGSGLETF
jgi:hypothetical protein